LHVAKYKFDTISFHNWVRLSRENSIFLNQPVAVNKKIFIIVQYNGSKFLFEFVEFLLQWKKFQIF
jgi:hypothetical protein